MGYSYSFVDNQVYGTDDVNAAFARLMTSGVGCYSGNTNFIAGMRESQAAYVESGICLDGCRAELMDAETVFIHAGSAFFADGSTITIDADGITLPVVPGEAAYVYFQRDPAEDSILPVISPEPGEGDFVPVAEIGTDQSIRDTRRFAVTKLAPNTANVYLRTQIAKTLLTGSMDTDTPYYTIDAGSAWFGYILMEQYNGKTGTGIFLPLEEGVKTTLQNPFPEDDQSPLLAFRKRGQYIDVYGKLNGSGGIQYAFDVIVC